MIYITGDTHGDFTRFEAENFPQRKSLTKEDYMIICGDFGAVWFGDERDAGRLDWLEKLPFTVLFVGGNHENYDALKAFPVTEWHGGKVQFIRPHVIHLLRGQLYELEGHTFFTMGGASSHDIDDGILDPDAPDFERLFFEYRRHRCMFRVNHISWWAEELPSDEEYEEARKTLERCGWKMDYIITHDCPDTLVDIIGRGFYEHDKLTAFLEEVYKYAEYSHWFFGHYHENYELGDRHTLLYEIITPLFMDEDEPEDAEE